MHNNMWEEPGNFRWMNSQGIVIYGPKKLADVANKYGKTNTINAA